MTKEVADRRLKEYGKNQLSERKKDPWYIKLIHELTTMFSILLWVGAGLCFLAYGLTPTDPANVFVYYNVQLYLGIVLAAVNFLTGTVTYF